MINLAPQTTRATPQQHCTIVWAECPWAERMCIAVALVPYAVMLLQRPRSSSVLASRLLVCRACSDERCMVSGTDYKLIIYEAVVCLSTSYPRCSPPSRARGSREGMEQEWNLPSICRRKTLMPSLCILLHDRRESCLYTADLASFRYTSKTPRQTIYLAQSGTHLVPK